MPLHSASRLASRLATVFDFVSALARRSLSSRVGYRGTVHVVTAAPGVYTIVHQRRGLCGAQSSADRIAQLRVVADQDDSYQLFFKKGNGRWTAYCADNDQPFIAPLGECLGEIARDPAGCYWS